jgi:hypothetical protein
MIEIASPATPQLSSLLPPRRWRSPNDAPGASRERGRREKYDPIMGCELGAQRSEGRRRRCDLWGFESRWRLSSSGRNDYQR